ncbi:hypothetical protein FH972_027091 [Carpinus fangiana]|uniref:Xylanase inhibitor C-terminal domain-containing protein n=1 Tax=Carpinus fangiana TaxID=176857 RepID=A0A5N6L5Z2_9ROSI|nr:hypothetical protein FH972_027091 [Carpinus fangiana]
MMRGRGHGLGPLEFVSCLTKVWLIRISGEKKKFLSPSGLRLLNPSSARVRHCLHTRTQLWKQLPFNTLSFAICSHKRKSAPLNLIPSWRPQSTRLSLKISSNTWHTSLEWRRWHPLGRALARKTSAAHASAPVVPQIDFVLHRKSVYWRMFGANSMVQVSNDVLCLGFVDGGSNPRTSTVIGGHQVEDDLLQFDIAKSRLGFSSSLLFRQTT